MSRLRVVSIAAAGGLVVLVAGRVAALVAYRAEVEHLNQRMLDLSQSVRYRVMVQNYVYGRGEWDDTL